MKTIDYLQDYLKDGWYVFPCREKEGASYIKDGETIIPDIKSPYVAHGLDDATREEDQINAWWAKFPNALIGVNCEKSNLTVIDIDPKNGGSFREDENSFIAISAKGKEYKFPKTRLHKSCNDGYHLVYSGVTTSHIRFDTGLDLLSKGRYFIAPPSTIVDGRTYAVVNDYPIVDFPEDILDIFPENSKGNGSGKNFIKLDEVPQGMRNDTLFRYGASLRGKGYEEEDILSELVEYNSIACKPPLDLAEVNGLSPKKWTRKKGESGTLNGKEARK